MESRGTRVDRLIPSSVQSAGRLKGSTMSRSTKSISYASTPKSREDQKANHHVIRAAVRETFAEIDIDNADEVDVVIPDKGRDPWDLVDYRSRMSFIPVTSSRWRWLSEERIKKLIAKGWRK